MSLPSLDELKAAFDRGRFAAEPAHRTLPRRTQAALLALPVVSAEVADALQLDGLDAAVESGTLSFENGNFRLLADREALERLGGWHDEVVALGQAILAYVATLDAHAAGRWLGLERWATLARLAGQPEAFALHLRTAALAPDGVRWIEAARSIERLLGGRLRLGVLRAARARLLSERRADDEVHLRAFVPPAEAVDAFEALWSGPGGTTLGALHLLGDGGTGKTTFIRHLTSHRVPERGGVVARLDFDHLDPDYPERDPGLLVAHLAEELLLQAETEATESELSAVGKLADGVRERLSGNLGSDEQEIHEIIQVFADAVTAFRRPVVLIFDTCEELARRRADGRASHAVEETLRRTEALLALCPTLRVVFSGRWPLPARSWLAVAHLTGFGEDDAHTYLHQRAARSAQPPAYTLDDPLRERMLHLAQVSTSPRRYSPFELNWLAGWIEAEPLIQVADLAYAPVDRYLEMRVLGRLHGPQVRSLLPAAALLGRFDAELLAACVDLPEATFSAAYDELTRQEWVRREGGRHELDGRLRARLVAWFAGEARPQVVRALEHRLLQGPWASLDPAFVVAWLRAHASQAVAKQSEPATGLASERASDGERSAGGDPQDSPVIPDGWDALIVRIEADGKWGFLAKVAELWPEAPAAIRADGLAAERWLGRAVSAEAWLRLGADRGGARRLRLLIAAGAVAAEPTDAGRRGAWVEAMAAGTGLLADGRVEAACVFAAHAIAEAHEGQLLLDRAVLAATERLLDGPLAALARATLGRLCWQAGERMLAQQHWSRVPTRHEGERACLYLPGITQREARTRLEVRRGLWPACVSASQAFSDVPPPETGGADLDRLKSLKIRAYGTSRLPRTLFDSVVATPRLPDPPGAAAHRSVDPWVVSYLEEAALATPTHLPAALATLARLRDEALRRTDALAVVRALAAAGARLTLAAREADLHGFGELFAPTGAPEDVDTCLSLSLWCAATFDRFRVPDGAPTAHARWRNDRDGHGAITAVEPHWAQSPDLQLDAWEACRLELTADDITLYIPDDPWAPEVTLRRAARARALGARPAPHLFEQASGRLGPRLAGRVVLDEAEHLALRLPALALDLFEEAARLFAKENDAFGVLRARLGQALAGMAVPDDDAVCDAKQAVVVTESTPPAWRQRAELMLAWLEEGARVGPKTRRVLAAWKGPRDPLLARIETARPPLESEAPRPQAHSQAPRPIGPVGPPAGRAPTHEDLLEAALSADLAEPDRRPLLLAGLPPALVGSLRRYSRPSDQLRSDLLELGRLNAVAGHSEPPLRTWLENAARLAKPRVEAQVFQRALATLVQGPGPVAVGITRLHLDVSTSEQSLYTALNRPIDLRWRLEGPQPLSGIEPIARPLGQEFWPSTGLAEAVRRLRTAGPTARLVPAAGALAFPWEGLLQPGGRLPVVRSGGRLARDLTRGRWVVGEDRDDLLRARQAWGSNAEGVSTRELLAHPDRPGVLHLLCLPGELGGQVRISLERHSEERVQETRASSRYLAAAEVVGPRPPNFCLLQVPPLREGEPSRWVHYQAALLRVFAHDLGRLGVTYILVLPAVPHALTQPIIERLAHLPPGFGAAHLLQTLTSEAPLRDACLLGPD